MKYMLITVKNILKLEIITEKFETKNEAYKKMKSELYTRLKIDNDENYMKLLENGMELSNAALNENDAYKQYRRH